MAIRNSSFVALLCILTYCSSDEFPSGLYHYQIERLLSAGDSSTWRLSRLSIDGIGQSLEGCSDTTSLLIVLVTDSVDISSLTPLCNGTANYDTLYIGRANASTDGLLFTDSLNFANGTVWFPTDITSLQFSLRYTTNDQEIEALYQKP
ncbi:MAG: hypothetical protein KI790_01565 [Cyclobacteriaceae bacterium]|nr:hypothetical protein [Cyclobacteriaceae bacterium HetDA_MAG_MS6]